MRLSPTFVLAMLAAAMACPGCGHRYIVRDASTFAAENAAGLARELEAASDLRDAAAFARDAGRLDLCVDWAGAALLIEAKAKPQTYRALWLAGLPYPNPDGTVPPVGTVQPDPGPSSPVADVTSVCGEVSDVE